MKHTFDRIVVGGGIEGLSTAYNLAKHRQNDVLLLDQFPIPNTRGSSGGETRITRLAYTHPNYVRMMVDSHKEWKDLENRTGLHLYRKTGVLVVGRGGSKVFGQYKSALKECDIPSDLMSNADLYKKWSHLFSPPSDYQGLFEPDGGVLFAPRCLRAFSESYLKEGGCIREGVQIEDIIPGDIVTLIARNGEKFHAKSVVLCIGPWAHKFLNQKLKLKLPIEPWRTFCCYWRVLGEDGDKYSMEKGVPMVLFREDDGNYFFKNSNEYPGLLYFGVHWGEFCDPDFPQSVTAVRYLEKSRKIAKLHKLNIDLSNPAVMESCFYTESIDYSYILDRHPKHRNIIIGTGFSGHGFKMAPVIGKMLADLAQNKKSIYPVEMFSLDRFSSKSHI